MGLFKKRSKAESLQKRYEKLMSEWHKLSTVNRSASDAKYEEAQKVLEEIETLQK